MKNLFIFLVMLTPMMSFAQEAVDRTVTDDSKNETARDKNDVVAINDSIGETEVVEIKEINWMTLEEAIEATALEPKKIMIDVYTSWCGPCKNLDKYTFHNADVVDYVNENFYAVKFNAEQADSINYKGKVFKNEGFDPEVTRGRNSVHELTKALGVSAYPTIVYMDGNGDVITKISGYMKATQIEVYLKLFATDAYLEVDTQEKWENYQVEFEGVFVE